MKRVSVLAKHIWQNMPPRARSTLRPILLPLFSIVTDKLNRGQRFRLLLNYFTWFLYSKPRKRTFKITFPNGLRSIVYPDSDSGVSSIYTRNVDFHGFAYVRSILKKGDFIIDAGCNVGNRTLMLADIAGGALLIDANEKCLERLNGNFRLNTLNMSNFHVVCKAVGSRKGIVKFTDIGGTSTQNRVVQEADKSGASIKTVGMTTIDDEMDNIGNPPCSFVKTDLEGCDLDALRGAVRTLQNGSMKLARFERWQEVPLPPFVDFFTHLNWVVFALDANGAPTIDEQIVKSSLNLFAMPRGIFSDFGAHREL